MRRRHPALLARRPRAEPFICRRRPAHLALRPRVLPLRTRRRRPVPSALGPRPPPPHTWLHPTRLALHPRAEPLRTRRRPPVRLAPRPRVELRRIRRPLLLRPPYTPSSLGARHLDWDPRGVRVLSLKPRVSPSRGLRSPTLIRFLLFASGVACSTQRAATAPAGDSTADSHPSAGLSFIEDDYPRA